MQSRLLIDAIVQQTTVLIAQLSTAAGIRAPLAHVADEVFLRLSAQIESQGVGRKVVADMFGMALRSYQKKVQRLTESSTERHTSLWEAVLEAVQQAGSLSRRELLQRFSHDDPLAVGSVLKDLVGSGLVSMTGRGDAGRYAPTSELDQRRLLDDADREGLAAMVWLCVHRGFSAVADIAAQLRVEAPRVEAAVAELVASGQVERAEGGALRTRHVHIPVGAEQGWEAAVYDHFRAVATAIANKVGTGRGRSSLADHIGGGTYSFDLHPGHPHADEVLALLERSRAQVDDLWQRVTTHNQTQPAAERPDGFRVWFYFGQNVEHADDDGDATDIEETTT